MKYPLISEIGRFDDSNVTFGGYNHQITCGNGEWYDMKNMSTRYMPILSTRARRGIGRSFKNPQGFLDKESLMWIDDCKLYNDGEVVELSGVEIKPGKKNMIKMGAYVIIFPDKIWYNAKTGECGYMEQKNKYSGNVHVVLTEANGKIITYHDSEYYDEHTPNDGDYMLSNSGGKASLKIYSGITKSWNAVATSYFQIQAEGIGKGLAKDDGVKITIDKSDDWQYASNIFVNDEGYRLSSNFTLVDVADDVITVVGLLDDEHTVLVNLDVERLTPDMAYVTECNNRLWGCSMDGHEIYASKLGDARNWNCYMGLSTDSWAATVGSDGVFTGAITFLGYPLFFKEDRMIKIAVSSTGAHQLKESVCRGVQKGSSESLVIIDELLMYKGTTDVCLYTGSIPVSISDSLGEVRYHAAKAGTIDGRYYISMQDEKDDHHLFVYDRGNQTWCREDEADIECFIRHNDNLFFLDNADLTLKDVTGGKDLETAFDWMIESGMISYDIPEAKYIGRVAVRMTLAFGTYARIDIQYDDADWETKVTIDGKGTRTFTIPIVPKRCDHFKIRITGKGDAKINALTKRVEKGSDFYV